MLFSDFSSRTVVILFAVSCAALVAALPNPNSESSKKDLTSRVCAHKDLEVRAAIPLPSNGLRLIVILGGKRKFVVDCLSARIWARSR